MEWNWRKVRNAACSLISGTRLGGGLDIWLTYDGRPINLIDLCWRSAKSHFSSSDYALTRRQTMCKRGPETDIWQMYGVIRNHIENKHNLALSSSQKETPAINTAKYWEVVAVCNSHTWYFCLNWNGLWPSQMWLGAVWDPKGSQSSSCTVHRHICVFWYFLLYYLHCKVL